MDCITNSNKRRKIAPSAEVDVDVDTVMMSSDIIRIVRDIVNTSSMLRSVADSKDIHTNKYPEFAKAFPVLFTSACEPNFDFVRFMYMMNMRDKIFNQATTVEDASKEVGQALFDEYVKPIVKTD